MAFYKKCTLDAVGCGSFEQVEYDFSGKTVVEKVTDLQKLKLPPAENFDLRKCIKSGQNLRQLNTNIFGTSVSEDDLQRAEDFLNEEKEPVKEGVENG